MTYSLKQKLYLCTSSTTQVLFEDFKVAVVLVTRKSEVLLGTGEVQTSYHVRTPGGQNEILLSDLAKTCEIFPTLDDAKAYLSLQLEKQLKEYERARTANYDRFVGMLVSQDNEE